MLLILKFSDPSSVKVLLCLILCGCLVLQGGCVSRMTSDDLKKAYEEKKVLVINLCTKIQGLRTSVSDSQQLVVKQEEVVKQLAADVDRANMALQETKQKLQHQKVTCSAKQILVDNHAKEIKSLEDEVERAEQLLKDSENEVDIARRIQIGRACIPIVCLFDSIKMLATDKLYDGFEDAERGREMSQGRLNDAKRRLYEARLKSSKSTEEIQEATQEANRLIREVSQKEEVLKNENVRKKMKKKH